MKFCLHSAEWRVPWRRLLQDWRVPMSLGRGAPLRGFLGLHGYVEQLQPALFYVA